MSGDGLTYDDAAARISALARFGTHPSLDGISTLCEALGRPQDALRVVQVAGTNGKTSTARMVSALLGAHGVKAGLFTSPHLHDYREQVEVGGEPIGQEAFARAAESVLDASARLAASGALAEPLTEFETMTAIALVAFADAGCEWAVLEVGMGGRWDATSVSAAEVAVVTSVGLDHTEHLGRTLEAIAEEKACVIRPGSTAILGPGVAGVLEVFLSRAQDVDARVLCVAEDPLPCEVRFAVTKRPGRPGGSTVVKVTTQRAAYSEVTLFAPSYQAPNAACAVAAAEEALGQPLDPVALRGSLERLSFPGRFEVLRREPPLVADGAHNPQAASVLADAIRESFGDEPPVIVLGVLADKDARGIVQALARTAGGFVATRSASPRALPEADLQRVIEEVTGSRPPGAPTVADAIRLAQASGGGVVACGSLTVAAEAREACLTRREGPPDRPSPRGSQ